MIGHGRLVMAAMLALTAQGAALTGRGTVSTPMRDRPTRREMEEHERKRCDDATAIAAAKTKRERKNAKRLRDAMKVGAGSTAIKRPNVKLRGAPPIGGASPRMKCYA